jgi:cytochrome P450
MIRLISLSHDCSGDMVHADVGGNHMLVVNSIDIAMELLQGKGNLYCDRPVLHVGGELAGLNQLSVFMDEGPAHKESRRFFAQELGTKALSARFVPLMEARIREFTNRLLGDPEVHDRLPHHIFR